MKPRAVFLADRSWSWPLQAVGLWACAWTLGAWMSSVAQAPWAGMAAGCLLCAAVASRAATVTRRALLAAGYPAALVVSGLATGLPPWAWLAGLAVLLLIYPVRAWRDAPVFPTTAGALEGLAARLSLPAAPRLLDAGCGLGHGLRALGREWPDARLAGIERSAVLAAVCRVMRPGDHIRCADMWQQSWQDFDLVYVFQRPESMSEAWGKACNDMRPGTWLVSLDFPVPGVRADVTRQPDGGRTVRAYRVPSRGAARLPAPVEVRVPLRHVAGAQTAAIPR